MEDGCTDCRPGTGERSRISPRFRACRSRAVSSAAES
jgi:hypothetical protein